MLCCIDGTRIDAAMFRQNSLGEVKGELRKVAWPTKKEVVNSTIIVLIAVVVMTTLIFGFDYASSKFVLFLFD